jgi:hypothetical protein
MSAGMRGESLSSSRSIEDVGDEVLDLSGCSLGHEDIVHVRSETV